MRQIQVQIPGRLAHPRVGVVYQIRYCESSASRTRRVNRRSITFDAAVVSGDTSKVASRPNPIHFSQSRAVRSCRSGKAAPESPFQESAPRKPAERSPRMSALYIVVLRSPSPRRCWPSPSTAPSGSRPKLTTWSPAGLFLPLSWCLRFSLPGSAQARSLPALRTPTATALPRCGSPPAAGSGLLLIYFIAPRARKFAQFTLPDLLEARYNQAARVLGTIAILFAYVAITSYQFKGGGNVLHLIFPDTVTPERALTSSPHSSSSPRPWPACPPSHIWMWPSARSSR